MIFQESDKSQNIYVISVLNLMNFKTASLSDRFFFIKKRLIDQYKKFSYSVHINKNKTNMVEKNSGYNVILQ